MNALHAPRWRTGGLLPLGVLAVCALAGCGGGNSTIGGTISGLASGSTVTLQDNGSDSLTLTANGSFSFLTSVLSGDAYDVTVSVQPAGQSCTVANGSGTVPTSGVDVRSISVTCAYSSSLVGTVSGLNPGTSVTFLNGTATAVATGNGSFAFPGILPGGTAYDVTITVQPAGQFCTIAKPSGSIVSGQTSVVTVTCA